MDIHSATEEAYKKGYEDGKNDAMIYAEWERYRKLSGTHALRCSNCNERNGRRTPYCPNCGAKMNITL